MPWYKQYKINSLLRANRNFKLSREKPNKLLKKVDKIKIDQSNQPEKYSKLYYL